MSRFGSRFRERGLSEGRQPGPDTFRFSPPIPLPASPEPLEGLGELANIGIAIPVEWFKGKASPGVDHFYHPRHHPSKNSPFAVRMEGTAVGAWHVSRGVLSPSGLLQQQITVHCDRASIVKPVTPSRLRWEAPSTFHRGGLMSADRI